jgi:hypothetical protein
VVRTALSREGDSSAEQEDPGAKEIDAEAEPSEGEKKDGLEAQGSSLGPSQLQSSVLPNPILALENVYDLRQPPHREAGVVATFFGNLTATVTPRPTAPESRREAGARLSSGRGGVSPQRMSSQHPALRGHSLPAARNFHGTTDGRTRYRLKMLAEVEGRWWGLLFLGFLAASLETRLRGRFCWTRH